MAFLLQKWDSLTETWDDLSQQAQKFDLDVHLDIFNVREIEYNGQTLVLDDENAIENGDYMRYRTDGSAENFGNMLSDIDSEMSQASGHNWIAGSGSPTFDVNTTVAGKMYYDAAVGSANQIKLDLPNFLTVGKTYRIKVKLRLNASGGTNVIRFGSGIGVASDHYVEFTPTGSEVEYEDTFTPVSGTGHDQDFFIYTLADSSGAFEIDDLQIYLESDPVLFSGYVSKLVHKLKAQKYEFDLVNEIADLKTMDIPRVLSGADIKERLLYGLPDDYSLVIMDDIAELMIESAPSGYDSITYPGDEVTGTDSNIYTCKATHEAAAANKPITGGSWSTYWELTGSTGGTWEEGKEYSPMRFNDLLYDTLLIGNGNVSPAGLYVLYCVVVNHELRFYGIDTTDSPTIIDNQHIEECEESLTNEFVFLSQSNSINEDLRGAGGLTTGAYGYVKWQIKTHKIMTTYGAEIMDNIGCARPGGGDPISGIITGIEKDGSMFTYELIYMEEVP